MKLTNIHLSVLTFASIICGQVLAKSTSTSTISFYEICTTMMKGLDGTMNDAEQAYFNDAWAFVFNDGQFFPDHTINDVMVDFQTIRTLSVSKGRRALVVKSNDAQHSTSGSCSYGCDGSPWPPGSSGWRRALSEGEDVDRRLESFEEALMANLTASTYPIFSAVVGIEIDCSSSNVMTI